ncbi:MAG: hypothetical protein JRI23_16580, partial [Deltaproteobacteria bacterium]|nr:hypothetical protein [Deltaproteobacteria bacterium]MBW2533393.1 hypothetical protein [Deltaproteobacteria bacterium]
AILVPGTVPGDQKFNPVSQACLTGACGFGVGWGTPGQALLSFDGSSIAENLYVVDGLNITNFSQGMGSSFVPMAFVEEVQVKQGGLDAEFGRTTGGVVNMVTRSGTNTLRGDATLLWSPESLQEQSPSTIQEDFADESFESTEVTASLGGPLAEDRLFFFLFLRYLDTERTALPNNARYLFEESTPYWGGKLDWSMTARHRLEASYISDDVNADVTRVVSIPELGLDTFYPGSLNRGGDNGILRYTGVLADNFLLSAQVGRNEFDRYDTSATDDCPVSIDDRVDPSEFLGCWVIDEVGTWSDTRTAARADVDWYLGNHSLRAGLDSELGETKFDIRYSGGVSYLYDLAGNWPGFFDFLPPQTELVAIQFLSDSGTLEIESQAAYAQDSWAVTRNVSLNIGLRWEAYEHRNVAGEPFIHVDDALAPRLGVVWDLSGEGRSKLYGSAGRYQIPYPTFSSFILASARRQTMDVYFLDGGANPDGSPEGLGPLIFPFVWSDGRAKGARELAANSLEPASQRELILGFEQLLGDHWRVGVRGVAREHEAVIEYLSLGQALWETYGVPCLSPDVLGDPLLDCENDAFRIANPGEGFDGWFDLDGDGELDPISLTAEQLGYPDPARDYYAVELEASRRFAGNWMLEASYVWSHTYGNYEGLVRSDTWGELGAGITTNFSERGLMDYASGDLPNDRRHFGRLYGAYAWPWGLGVGGSFFIQSGSPINSFGHHPTDPWAGQQGFLLQSFFTQGEPTPRGSLGRTETVWWLDLSVRYDWRWGSADLYARVDAFNVLDNQGITELYEYGDTRSLGPNPYWGEPIFYQSPRSVRFGVGVSF